MADNKQGSAPQKLINPFEAGVSLESFIAGLGSASVRDYVKGQIKFDTEAGPQEFDEADVKWLEGEITKHGYNVVNKERLLAESAKEWEKLNKNGQK